VEDIVEKIVNYGKKFGDVEVLASKRKRYCIKYEGNILKELSGGDEYNIGVRITIGKKFGYSSTSNINLWKKCVENAVKLAKVSKEMEIEVKLPKRGGYSKIPICKRIVNFPVEKMAEKCNEMMNSALEYDERIHIANAEVNKEILETYFGNSNGIIEKQESADLNGWIEVNIGETLGFEERNSRYEIPDFAWIGREASKLCVSMLNSRGIKTMKADVIFDYFAVSSLFNEILVPALCADNVQRKKSYFHGKIGEKVAVDEFYVVDDGKLENGLCSSSFDAEGTPTQRTTLIKNGILIGFLYDNYTAQIDGKESTGNCSSLSSRPSVGESNFIIKNGEISKDEMIENTKEGVIVRAIVGAIHMNKITGDFSVNIENSHYIENGKLIYPIKHAMVSGNLFKLLKQIKEIGKEVRQEGSIISPTIKFENVQIIGNE